MPSRTVQRRRERKAALVALRGGCCSRCGYDRSLRALHFHHTDPDEKTTTGPHTGGGASIFRSSALDRQWPPTDPAFWMEFEITELICANCHMETEEQEIHGHTDWKSDIDPAVYAGLQAWHERLDGSTPRHAPEPKRESEVLHG